MTVVYGGAIRPQFGRSSRLKSRISTGNSSYRPVSQVATESTLGTSISPEMHPHSLPCREAFEEAGKRLLVCVDGHAGEQALLDALKLVNRSLEHGTKLSRIQLVSPPGGYNSNVVSRLVGSELARPYEKMTVLNDLTNEGTQFDIVVVASDSEVELAQRLRIIDHFRVGECVNMNAYHVFPFDSKNRHGGGSGRITVRLSDTRHPIVCAMEFGQFFHSSQSNSFGHSHEIGTSRISANSLDLATKDIASAAATQGQTDMSVSEACCIDMKQRFGTIKE